jgi:hypothetical protein
LTHRQPLEYRQEGLIALDLTKNSVPSTAALQTVITFKLRKIQLKNKPPDERSSNGAFPLRQ